jgi:hypothetical protein
LKLRFFVRRATAAAGALAAFLFLALPAGAQVAVTIDGNGVSFSPAPIVRAGRVFVPLRGVFERLGASVVYSSGTINATEGDRVISLQIGSSQATVNGQPETLDVAPFIIGASTYVPLRFVSEALGASVSWDDADRVVAIDTAAAAPSVDYAAPASGVTVDVPPPPLPVYEQPDVPAPNAIWQPGYWAWGPYGYYWVPGTWVEAPQPGYLWTPGYWAWSRGGFVWNQGYWAVAVGFYGGVNYGAGYYGNGYTGGQWADNAFRYNTYVTHVDTTIVHNVYVDRSVVINNSTTRISYNGGPSGLQARPTPQELALAKAPRLAPTAAQQQHVQTAAQDRRLLANVNHNLPPVLTVVQPLSASNRPAGLVPVTESDRINAQTHTAAPYHAPLFQTAAPHHTPPPQSAAPYRAPLFQTATPYRTPPPQTAAPYRAPLFQTAAPYRTPPPQTAAPYRSPPLRAFPVNSTPTKQPKPARSATPHARATDEREPR